MWKIAVQAPPIDGRANKAATDYLAEIAGVRRGDVGLVRGASARRKVFDVVGVSTEALEERLRQAADVSRR